MDNWSRKWFDEAYECSKNFSIPFCVFTQEIDYKEAEILLKACKKDISAKMLYTISYGFSKQVPSPDDFDEEKKRILGSFIPELRRLVPEVGSAIIFGRSVGDIDIGLISPKLTGKGLLDALCPEIEICRGYPLVDWSSLFYFISNSGFDLGTKIVQNRLEINKYQPFSNLERMYFQATLDSAKLLWGYESELDSMQSLNNRLN